MGGQPNIEDTGGDGFAIEHLIDRQSDAGAWALALSFGNHPIRVSDHISSQCPERDCGQPAGTICTFAMCPGKRLGSSFHAGDNINV